MIYVRPSKAKPIIDGKAECFSCGEARPIEEFPKRSNRAGGLRFQCRACRSHRSLVRKVKQYGLTVNQYEAMLEAQDHKCWICRSDVRLAIDHNHETGKVRGLLCNVCNLAIGWIEENPLKVDAALIYLKEHNVS